MDEQTKNNLREFEELAKKKMEVGPDSEWGVIGNIAMWFGITPPLVLRIIYYVWLDLKTRIEAKA